jgi:hypothetical protein
LNYVKKWVLSLVIKLTPGLENIGPYIGICKGVKTSCSSLISALEVNVFVPSGIVDLGSAFTLPPPEDNVHPQLQTHVKKLA